MSKNIFILVFVVMIANNGFTQQLTAKDSAMIKDLERKEKKNYKKLYLLAFPVELEKTGIIILYDSTNTAKKVFGLNFSKNYSGPVKKNVLIKIKTKNCLDFSCIQAYEEKDCIGGTFTYFKMIFFDPYEKKAIKINFNESCLQKMISCNKCSEFVRYITYLSHPANLSKIWDPKK